MRVEISKKDIDNDFVKKVEELSGENLATCYQCGRCSAGCPSSVEMDILPSQAIRFAQLGQKEELFKSRTMWYCAACLTCDSRCPKGIDISRIMEALRTLILHERGIPDTVSPEDIPEEVIEKIPQMALVSGYRKYTS